VHQSCKFGTIPPSGLQDIMLKVVMPRRTHALTDTQRDGRTDGLPQNTVPPVPF